MLVHYADGADPMVQYMLWPCSSALAPVTTRLEQANLAVISLRRTIANQSSAIATSTTEVRKARNNTSPPTPTPAKNTRPIQTNKNDAAEKTEGKNKQSYAEIAKNAKDAMEAGFTKVVNRTKPARLFTPNYTRINMEVILETNGPIPNVSRKKTS